MLEIALVRIKFLEAIALIFGHYLLDYLNTNHNGCIVLRTLYSQILIASEIWIIEYV